jgi:hypothetical protein
MVVGIIVYITLRPKITIFKPFNINRNAENEFKFVKLFINFDFPHNYE